MLQQNYNVAAYCRLSIDDGNSMESNSINTQKQIIARYAEEQGLKIKTYYCDDGFTGLNFQRPDFERMISDIDDGKINMVITKDLSRLGRNYILTGQYTELYFPSMGVRYVAINDGVDTALGDNEITPFKHILNEFYCRDLSKKIKSAKRNQMLNGEYIANWAPFGYIKDPNDKHKLIIDEPAAEVVRKIFNWAAEGYGALSISRRLRKEKIERPVLRKLAVGWNAWDDPDDKYFWQCQTIQRMLKNKIYLGHMAQNKRKSVSFKLRKKVYTPESEWIVVENTHEAIIDQRTFDVVQEFLRKRHTPQKFVTDVLTGIIKCDVCGKTLGKRTPPKDRKGNLRKVYFHCQTYTKKGKEMCTPHYLLYDNIYELLLNDIRKHAANAFSDGDKMLKQLSKLNENKAISLSKQHKKDIEKATRRIGELDTIISNLYEDKALGKISEERYSSLSDKYEREQAELREKLQVLTQQLEEYTEKQENSLKFVDTIKKYTELMELTPSIINELIDRVIVGERVKTADGYDQRIDIYYKFVGLLNE